jgi:hypothetical protein
VKIGNSIARVFGAKRGFGSEHFAQFLSDGVAKIYAAARTLVVPDDIIALDPDRVVPVRLGSTRL